MTLFIKLRDILSVIWYRLTLGQSFTGPAGFVMLAILLRIQVPSLLRLPVIPYVLGAVTTIYLFGWFMDKIVKFPQQMDKRNSERSGSYQELLKRLEGIENILREKGGLK